ncbi:MAG: alcohol dehydrogenase catalytic domain-containing protein [Verrucomicrobiota bacterium]|nr:alcohol dehydrogenase catalytic domain-containing protein [Verrucomicrobiota bacterium]
MKAAVLYGKEDVRIEEIASPPLQPGEARIRIDAALTCGTDLKVFRRGYHARMIVPPATFGHEFAGTILEISPGVTTCRPGDRVVVANSAPCGVCFYCREQQENLCDDLLFLNGAYAQEIVVPSRLVSKNLLQLQPTTSFHDAALTEPLACVVQGIDDCQLKPDQRLLIIGSGPIGLMFARLASHLGAQVTLAGRGENRLQCALRLGAANVIDISREQLAGKFDVVIEAVGKPETWEQSVSLLRKGGTVNLFGGCPAGTTISLDTGLIHYSNLKLIASFHHTPRTIRKALACIEAGVIQAADFVDGHCALDQLPALLAEMTRGNKAVKTLVLPG